MTEKLAGIYAKALFDSADKVEQQKLLSNFEDLSQIYNKTPKLHAFLNSPEISKQDKENILKIPFKENPNFLGFLSLLLQKGRIKYLIDIAAKYREIYTVTYGITPAHLTTAISLDIEMKEQLTEKLNRIYSKQFELTYDVNPQIIGGGVLVIADQMIDFSIKDKLNRLRSHLRCS